MKILIAGASGFIGKEITKVLMKNHHITVLGRSMKHLEQTFPSNLEKVTWDRLNTYDAKQFDIIINLSGSNIGAKKWNKSVKDELIASRTLTNTQLINWLIKQKASPHYYCANAVGIYGAYDNDSGLFDENSTIQTIVPHDFLHEIAIAWEASLKSAIEQGIRVTTLRFGVVLKKGEGMLKKLELPFSLGLGSTLGAGKQFISWIHYEDLVNAILFLLDHLEVTGPVNITSPNPITQHEFATQFSSVLKRPLLLKMPAFLVKLLFGEMGEYLLLKGQRVFPKRLIELGFKFAYPNIVVALNKEY